jgi:hypothetical protein
LKSKRRQHTPAIKLQGCIQDWLLIIIKHPCNKIAGVFLTAYPCKSIAGVVIMGYPCNKIAAPAKVLQGDLQADQFGVGSTLTVDTDLLGPKN